MQYTPLAIAAVAYEAVERFNDNARPFDRVLASRIGARIARDIVYDPYSGRANPTRDAHFWYFVIRGVEVSLDSWLRYHHFQGSLVERVGRAVLGSCRAFVGLERRCGRGEE